MRTRQYAPLFLLTLTACFALQGLTLRAVGGRTTKSESNYFSSVARVQAAATREVRVMLVGSSIAGRLPDRTQGFPGTANLGVDGGSAIDGLRAIDRGIVPTAKYLVVEANMLHRALDRHPSEIGLAMQRPWFKVGLELPMLAAYARPAAFVYSKLLEHRIGSAPKANDTEDLGVHSLPAAVLAPSSARLTSDERVLVDEMSGIFRRLHGKGSLVLLVWLPPARSGEAAPPDWILDLARRAGVPFWDLGQEAATGRVALTDGVHMDASSAARTMRSLGRAVGDSS